MKTMANFPLFRAEVKKALSLRNWRCRDLAKATGYSVSSVYNIMNGGRCSEKFARAITTVLDIPEYLAT